MTGCVINRPGVAGAVVFVEQPLALPCQLKSYSMGAGAPLKSVLNEVSTGKFPSSYSLLFWNLLFNIIQV